MSAGLFAAAVAAAASLFMRSRSAAFRFEPEASRADEPPAASFLSCGPERSIGSSPAPVAAAAAAPAPPRERRLRVSVAITLGSACAIAAATFALAEPGCMLGVRGRELAKSASTSAFKSSGSVAIPMPTGIMPGNKLSPRYPVVVGPSKSVLPYGNGIPPPDALISNTRRGSWLCEGTVASVGNGPDGSRMSSMFPENVLGESAFIGGSIPPAAVFVVTGAYPPDGMAGPTLLYDMGAMFVFANGGTCIANMAFGNCGGACG
mmetsp:Transcript_13732/g.34303  ORF Transcript_13732/g.34303 Transcript_13732/m.34303 type:complete len:263 (+) Transcript_13732:348-1136(+)